MPNSAELVEEVAKFEKSKLAKAKTMEKYILPNSIGNYIIFTSLYLQNIMKFMKLIRHISYYSYQSRKR